MLAGVGKIGRIGGAGSGSAAGLTGFVSVWATTGAFETITIPTQNVGTFNALVDWGDSSPPETITAYNGFSHEYAAIDDYTISITGVFPNIYMRGDAVNNLKLKKITNLGAVGWETFSSAFFECSNLTEFTAGSTDTTGVTNMNQMFRSCTGLTSVDVSSFNTSSVSLMSIMFFNCGSLTSMVGVEDFDITGLDGTGDLTNFLTNGKMTTAQYDALLVKWEAQASGIPAMTASFGASILTSGGTADTAKQSLINTYGWTVQDGVTP